MVSGSGKFAASDWRWEGDFQIGTRNSTVLAILPHDEGTFWYLSTRYGGGIEAQATPFRESIP